MGNGTAVLEKPCNSINIDAELEKIGVSLQVKVDGLLVEWKNNGYIPELYGAEKAEIRLTTCDKNVRGFNVDPYNPNKRVVDFRRPEKPSVPKAVTGAKNYSKSESDGRKIYRKTVHIEDGARTNYPGNCIRLFRRDEFIPHKFKITEIGFVCQGDEGYITVQDVYEGVCYQKDDKLVCPAFEKWTSLVEFLRQIQAEEGGFGKLPLLTTCPPFLLKKKTFKGFKDGSVKFFNLNTGWGVIETISGDVYFSYESIISESKPLFLKKGAEVSFEKLIPSDKGTFKRKAIGVRLIG